ncbi:MAG: HAMP domain-containing sensor histidine kinase, partial [Candidatus Omnitrophica bacterium]|nr:HAMP domain-containing sensor histidine kinase [Candidatus Omnitrophota bacterium]
PLAHTMMYQVNLIEVVQNTVNFLKFQLEQENITLEVHADGNSYPVLANHDELGQVVTNIVLNAKDAIKQIKKSGTVYISISEDKTNTIISIKDEGVGIPKTILNRIFDPFYTTKEVGKGLGLGLSICQTIIEKHNGKILVESQVNKGSTFIIKLPKFKEQPKNTETVK